MATMWWGPMEKAEDAENRTKKRGDKNQRGTMVVALHFAIYLTAHTTTMTIMFDERQ